MTSMGQGDRSHESIINDVLARILRERLGFSAAAETLLGGKRPDIIVRLPQGDPIVLEIELEPAPTVVADALSRLGMEIDGRKVQNVFAIKVPAQIRTVDQRRLFDRLGSAALQWQEWRNDGTSGPWLSGGVSELGSAVRAAAPPSGDLEEAVTILDTGARRAGAVLYGAPGTLERISEVFGADASEECANMAALVVINAMVFHERLASAHAAYRPVASARRHGRFSRIALLRIWEEILDIDYYPIFSMARDVLENMSDSEAADMLDSCAETVEALFFVKAVGRHDLAGQIFNRLISDRKLLAAYYTQIPTSILLAGLALSPDRWPHVDWTDAGELGEMCVVDPACGTGTLLMAAYRQILQNHTSSDGEAGSESIHRALVENVIVGTDVVQAAIHLTAATLAGMSPSVEFSRMQIHTLHFRREESGDIHLGSLDWLVSPEAQASFSASKEQVGAKSGESTIVQRPHADLVISNPPFTRRGSDAGKGEALARVLAPRQGSEEAQGAIAKRTSELLRGTPANQMAGHASSFTVLADRMVKPGGRIALVLPVTALFGESWAEIRQMLSCKYDVEYVVSSHDPEMRSMSYDTAIAETLLVARRMREDESPSGRGVFVNLWRAAHRETDALAIVNALKSMDSVPSLKADGPPVGGSPLMVGGEQWGEVVDGPVGERHWKGARWRRALAGQFAAALERGELWSEYGNQVIARLPVAWMGEVCNVGPQHRRIRGSLGVFDGYHGYNEGAQFPALWAHSESVHQTMHAEPNAWLSPQPGRDHTEIWSHSGTLHVTPAIRYNSQRVMALRTTIRTLGMSTWFTLSAKGDGVAAKAQREIALALWCNSTLGIMLHANNANSAQFGRGTGHKGTLEGMSTLDVGRLEEWQLEEALSIWREFEGREFESFHRCAVDPVRIALDERILRGLFGLGEDAVDAVANLRALLAGDPSIHGGKRAELPG